MAKQYTVPLLRKEKLAKDTWLFAFQKPQGYVFTPGQYQTFTLNLPNGKTDWRDMTITSSPDHKELWLVTKIQKEHSEFKEQLLRLPIGSSIHLAGPNGGFTMREEKPHVFLAGGIGINVFHSILMDGAKRNILLPITLIASFATQEDIIFHEDLKKIENEKRKIVYTLTKEAWEGEKGRITQTMIQKYIPDWSNTIFMVAGGQAFVDAMNEMLLQMKIPQDNIRIDYFTGY